MNEKTFSSQVKRLNHWLQTPLAFLIYVGITVGAYFALTGFFWPNHTLDETFYSAVADDPSLSVCPSIRADQEGISLIAGACLPGHAIIAAYNFGQHTIKDEEHSARLTGTCCPLPADALARNERGGIVYSEPKLSECGEDHVVVGGSTNSDCGSTCYMSCAKINTDRYKLGEERRAVAWATGDDPGGGGRGWVGPLVPNDLIFLRHIPLAYRHAIARGVYDTVYRDLSNPYGKKANLYNKDGCVGSPVGSLLVRKASSSCDGFFFKQLLHKDTGKPVRFIPHCDAIEGLYTNSPKCVVNKAWR